MKLRACTFGPVTVISLMALLALSACEEIAWEMIGESKGTIGEPQGK